METMALEQRPDPARTGIWIAIAAISMSFAAYTSALIVRQSVDPAWMHFRLPRVLFFNTAVVLASSVTLYLASPERRREAGLAELPAAAAVRASKWIYLTLALGTLFLIGQLIAWRELQQQGITLASSPSSSFFYLLTAVHGIHLLGGLAALTYVAYRIRQGAPAPALRAHRSASIYWHFMAALWVYLFLVLAARI